MDANLKKNVVTEGWVLWTPAPIAKTKKKTTTKTKTKGGHRRIRVPHAIGSSCRNSRLPAF